MLLLPGHSEFSPALTATRVSDLLKLAGEIALTARLIVCLIQDVFSLHKTVRFCTHFFTGISKQIKTFYRSELQERN